MLLRIKTGQADRVKIMLGLWHGLGLDAEQRHVCMYVEPGFMQDSLRTSPRQGFTGARPG